MGGFTAAMLGHNDGLNKYIFGNVVNELMEDQKERLANIGTLAGTVSGRAVEASTGAGSGALTGRTETENNSVINDLKGDARWSVHCKTCKHGPYNPLIKK